ncbi:MAG: NAD(P)/FAD-dependent oxidoreductase [Fimbriimonas ginsengisoli]|uniref:NAD(P)/FAD-dependent oxidoreductase n=1 Tax=Fimbriimonas ginsengisoli TaxID=1005039 RepID=A0A931LW77_FIMGI|nr:NAD(P)/FAD-dependent oxidoreductase [Fimbriimonas ginsengisoli]
MGALRGTAGARKRVVIVGGGFGGLYAAKALAGKPVDVLLIDRNNHHVFQPLLYQVAAGGLSPGQIAAPLRHILRRASNIEVLLAEVAGFDLDGRTLRLKDGAEVAYDALIVAVGARHAYFHHDAWEAHAPGLKTLEDAIEMRRRILTAFEEAAREAILTGKAEPLTFAVIGAGPTGVELAGAIADIARRIVAGDYKAIDTRKARVLLLEGSDRVLPTFPNELSIKARRQLEELGVEVRTKALVTEVEARRIQVEGEWIPVRAALWAAGVAASPLASQLGAELDAAGRVLVQADLSLPGHSDVFVIGDLAALRDARGVAVPGMAAAAVQMGRAAAANALRHLDGEPGRAFIYKDKGSLATIGRNRAVAQIGRWRLSGLVAWLVWALVHVSLLIGFGNRVRVMGEWIWAYFKRELSAGLITGDRRQ